MKKSTTALTKINIETEPEFSFEEFCLACDSAPEFLYEVIEYGIVDPKGLSKENWKFSANHLRRVRTIVHLQKDLEVNLPGAALAVELLEEMEAMRKQIELMKKYFIIKHFY